MGCIISGCKWTCLDQRQWFRPQKQLLPFLCLLKNNYQMFQILPFSLDMWQLCDWQNQCKGLKSLVENKPQDDMRHFCSSHLNPPQSWNCCPDKVLRDILEAETRTHRIKPSVYWSRLSVLGLRQTSRRKMGCRGIQRALYKSICMAVRYLVISGKKKSLLSRKTSCLPEQWLLPWLWTVPSEQPRQCSLPIRLNQDAKFSKSAATPFCVQRLLSISS